MIGRELQHFAVVDNCLIDFTQVHQGNCQVIACFNMLWLDLNRLGIMNRSLSKSALLSEDASKIIMHNVIIFGDPQSMFK